LIFLLIRTVPGFAREPLNKSTVDSGGAPVEFRLAAWTIPDRVPETCTTVAAQALTLSGTHAIK
jgi:hypothetical protein